MKYLTCRLVCTVLLVLAPTAAPASQLVRVTGDRVNLRARPSMNAEVVSQAERGDILVAKSFQQEWVEVLPDDKLSFWVHTDFVTDGQVTATKLNVRAGPGINYSIVATLEKGDQVVTREHSGEWIGIEPPVGSALWVNVSLVELLRTGSPDRAEPIRAAPERTEPLVTPPPRQRVRLTPSPRPAPPAVIPREAAAERAPTPPGLNLIPLEGQGKQVEKKGTLKRAGFSFRRPGEFRLVQTHGGQSQTLCYVRGNTDQLESFVGTDLTMRGRLYWVQGVRYPVLIPEQIVPHAGP